MEKLSTESLDIKQENINKIKELFPNVVTEGKIDFEVLKNILDDEVDEKQEKYQFTWNGKRDAIRLAQMPSTGTLRPDKESSKEWDTTENLYIEGDNLEVLKLLQKSYYGKIKMIYIDPPYNTGGDFVYKDDFKDNIKNYKEQTKQTNQSNPETSGRYHTDWLNMMYPRLMLARNLLTDDGVIFISIDDNEVENLKKICSEIFGESNFIAQIIWERSFSPVNLKKHFSECHDYILCFAKSINFARCNGLSRTEETDSRYSNPDNDFRGEWTSSDMTVGPVVEEKLYEIKTPSGIVVKPASGRCWLFTQDKFEEMVSDNRIWFGKNGSNMPRVKKFLSEVKQGITPITLWKYSEVGHSQSAKQNLKELFEGKSYFDYPKPVPLIERIIKLYSNNNDNILDFFSGSATTANAVMNLNYEDGGNRKFILVQLPELLDEKSEAYKNGYKTICDLGKERIQLSGNKIIEKSIKEQNLLDDNGINKLDIGFKVFKLDNTNFNTHNSKTISFESLLEENTFDLERSKLDILYEIMLKYGVFDKPVETLDLDGKNLFSVALNYMLVVIDEILDERDINKIIELKPEVVIFDERCFKDDNDKMNIDIRLKAAGIKEVKSI